MKYSLTFGLLGALFCYSAVLLGDLWYLLFWLAISFFVLSAGYAGIGPKIFCKQPDGTIPLWQWVPFVEVGRVAPSWNVDELHSDMKWDVGFGVRAMAKGLVVRIDTAVSDEGLRVQMMVSQTFQF